MSPIVRFVKDRSGAMALTMALATPLLIGSVGLSIDTVQWVVTKRQMQRQADSGAIAGAYGLSQQANVQAVVTDDLSRNARVRLSETPIIENAPTAGPQSGNNQAVRVLLQTQLNLPFAGYFMDGPVLIAAEATAALASNGEFCALSLERENATGITMWGSSTVNLGCGMATNSVSANAVAAGGSSTVFATPISAVGGIQPSSNYSPGTTFAPYSIPQSDPFRAIPNPVPANGAQNGSVNSNKTATLNPGTYSSMDLKGTVTLNPGTYIIDGGEFSAGAQAKITGHGVTIVLTSKNAASNPYSIAQVKINGGAQLDLTAPSSGTYKGVLFYQDRRATLSNQTNKINGNSNSKLQGAFYFPSQEIEFIGTSGMDTDCIQLVARRITWSGNSAIANNCPAGSGSEAFKGTVVRLVG